MKRLSLVSLVTCVACSGEPPSAPPPAYPLPAGQPPPGNAAPAGSPLSATLDGRPFEVRGIIGTLEPGGVLVAIFARPATCGTPSAESMPGEHHFQIYVDRWPNVANGMHIDLWNSPTAVNTVDVLPAGNGGSAQAMTGSVDVLNVGPAGGTIAVDARNGRGAIRGQVPFAICR